MTNPERRGLVDRIKTIEERLIMIVNPMSKKGAVLASRVRSLVRREGMNLEETSTDHPDDIGSTVEFWSKRFGGSRVIMVVGGDGAINQVINNVMLSKSNKNVVMVPIPAGTANDFSRALGFKNADSALSSMVDFNIRPIDLLKVEIEGEKSQVKYCTNILGLGLDGDLAHKAQKYKKYGVPGYWYSSLKRAVVLILTGVPLYDMRIKTNGFEQNGKLTGVMFSNINRYGQNFLVAPDAKLDDGKIHVMVVKPMGGIKTLLAALSMLRGLQNRFPAVQSMTCESLDVELMDDVYSQEDGEVCFYPRGTRMHLSLERQAMNVMTNAAGGPGIS